MANLLLASSKSNPNNLSKAIVSTVRENGGKAEIQAIGAGAVNQTVKALAIARGHVAASGEDIIFTTSFVDVDMSEGQRTALKFQAETIRR